jgi:hypothetical protein
MSEKQSSAPPLTLLQQQMIKGYYTNTNPLTRNRNKELMLQFEKNQAAKAAKAQAQAAKAQAAKAQAAKAQAAKAQAATAQAATAQAAKVFLTPSPSPSLVQQYKQQTLSKVPEISTGENWLGQSALGKAAGPPAAGGKPRHKKVYIRGCKTTRSLREDNKGKYVALDKKKVYLKKIRGQYKYT